MTRYAGYAAVALMLLAPSAYAAPVTYQLAKDHTDVTFTISHAGFTMKHGSFEDMRGTLVLDEAAPEASTVDVTVSMNSIKTNHLKRDTDLQGKIFLDAAGFPTMRFISTKVVRTGPSTADITGNLTLHGVTRPLVLHAKLNRVGPSPFGQVQTAGFTATGALKRSDYGISEAIPMIGDDVNITIDTEFAVPRAANR